MIEQGFDAKTFWQYSAKMCRMGQPQSSLRYGVKPSINGIRGTNGLSREPAVVNRETLGVKRETSVEFRIPTTSGGPWTFCSVTCALLLLRGLRSLMRVVRTRIDRMPNDHIHLRKNSLGRRIKCWYFLFPYHFMPTHRVVKE